jgi:hypothetical protein
MAIAGDIPGAAGRRTVRPSRLWYWAAGSLAAGAAACIALAAAGFVAVDHLVGDFQRVPVPGQAEISLAQPGGYIVYIERPGHCCSVNITMGNGDGGQRLPFPSWSMRVLLQPADGGTPVTVSTWRGAREIYNLAGHNGQRAMSFTVSTAGRYILRTADVRPAAIMDLAVGRDIGRGTLVPLILLLAGVLALGPAGIATGVITFVRRRAARRVPGFRT